ncbi:uncharacterized protein LOC115620286 [Scaptodrosophila lebanonensis]|uniref:Uncharacterized protein LOC115620286 n=1 Tax=Drosophila lebanonensis TaxID=7225 RepID=A0A6J2T289_DROLE|nr:uncharacterized protein LOC115620286 [Scaptodrosophila lebanonensis]
MAYINIAEWTPDQVTDWIKGLDDSMKGYLYEFSKHEISGRVLLNIRPYELENLGMKAIGHQEIVLDAVENLRNFHYHLKDDNLQFMALQVGVAARNLHRELAKNHADSTKIDTRTLHDITRTIATIKPLIGSLERSPFRQQDMYCEYCSNVLRCGLELATIAQRDRFAVQPVASIKASAERLERLADFIIRDLSDPMVLQPSSLNLVTLKKREPDLGFNIESSYNGIHRVTAINHNSPVHSSGKIEDGDEIVQINYQTVVGWQHKTVLQHLREALPDVVLTVKKRPKHTKMFGQIYMQPYRLPSKKRSIASRWAENLPSPRAAFLTLDPDNAGATIAESVISDKRTEEKKELAEAKANVAASSDSDSSCSDIQTPTDPNSATRVKRLYYPKPRSVLQRRNTICGDKPWNHKNSDLVIPSWHERKTEGVDCDPNSPSIRDKSISFGYGLEIAPRPTTIGTTIGIGGDSSDARRMQNEVRKLKQLTEAGQEAQQELEEPYKPGVSKVVRFDANMKVEDYVVKNEKFTCNVENTILETFEPIPFADEGDEDALETLRNCKTESTSELLEALDRATRGNETPLVEAINAPLLQNRRGRLDKSHSTPAYDNSGEESDTPPAIEPRKEFLLVTPPAPPPRPRKQKELTPPVVPVPPPKPANLLAAAPAVQPGANDTTEISELHTPTKSRTLTLKKKHNLMAKRRNTNLKILGTGDIQGYLYRRKKNHRGVTYWARVYFVMLDTILYGFRNKQATTASLVIFLPGFTVSLATEIHSKPHAFMVYYMAKTFYFAAESLDALNQWVEFLRQASLKVPVWNLKGGSSARGEMVDTKDLYSENDSSGEENEALIAKNLCTPSPQGAKEMASSLSSGSVQLRVSGTSTSFISDKHDRSYFDSLFKFKMGPFKSNSAKLSSDIPVPTEQYRSFRKVPGGSCGIQIGANTPGYHDPAMPPTAVTPLPEPATATLPRKLSRSSSRSSVVSNTESSASLGLGPPTSPAPTLSSLQHQSSEESPSSKSSSKQVSRNFMHASNPNLVEFDFNTTKNLMQNKSAGSALDATHHHHNTQGFVTLKDLMLRKQEEEAQEMYNNRVHLGVEKHNNKRHMRTESTASQQSVKPAASKPKGNGEKLPKIQSCSLPKTPDYEISFKPDDERIKNTRTLEGQKLRDFGYELICGDEPVSNVSSNATASRQNSHNSNASTAELDQQTHQQSPLPLNSRTRNFQLSSFLHKGHKKHSSGSVSSASEMSTSEKFLGGTKKKNKGTGDRRFPFTKHSVTSGAPPAHAMTMTLPLNKKSKSNHALDTFACVSGSSSGAGGSNIKKSQTYNQDLRDKVAGTKYDAPRKNSAPIPIFSKLSIPSSSGTPKTSKERRILGSPLLHRTIYGHHQQQHNVSPALPITPPISTDPDCEQEIFSQVIFPTPLQRHLHGDRYRGAALPTAAISNTNLCASEALQPPLPPAPPPPSGGATPSVRDDVNETVSTTPKVSNTNSVDSKAATPDYPNMECPPVFEPEIYSLSEPNTSLSRLILRNNSSPSSGGEHHQT